MIFTQGQIQDMLSILRKYELIFIGNQLGLDFLSAADKAILLAAGIDVDQFKNKQGIIEHAFLFGILAEAIGDARAKNMTYKQFQKFLKSGNFIPLTEEEEFALQNVKQRAYTDITNLANRMRGALSNVVLKNNQEQTLIAQKIVRDKTVKAIELRQGATALASSLGEVSQNWESDWLRVAYYLLHEAYNTGRAQSVLRQYGADAEIYFDVFPGACESCRELYLVNPEDPDSEPIVFKLKDLIANGNNIGRKKADWKPTIAPIHPYCFNSPAVKIYTSKGVKNISDIQVGDLVLTHRGRYRRVTNVMVREYDCERENVCDLFYSFPGIGYVKTKKCRRVRAITGNHPVLTKRGWVTVENLTIGDKIYIPALVCSKCGKVYPINAYCDDKYSRKYDNDLCYDCLRTKIAKEQWKDENFHKYMSSKTTEQMKKRYENMSYEDRLRISSKARKAIAKKYPNGYPWMKEAVIKANKTNGKKKTFIERKLLYFCESLGVETVTGMCLRNKEGKFRNNVTCYFPDIFIPKLGIVLEADGIQWHKDKEYDSNRDKDIKQFFGYDTFRFSEEDIVNNGDKVFDELNRIFNNHEGNYRMIEVTLHAIRRRTRSSKRGSKRCNLLYNFSVEEDESYIADGIVVHNCRCILNHKPEGFAWDENLRAFTKPIKKVSKNPKLRNVKLNIKVSKG